VATAHRAYLAAGAADRLCTFFESGAQAFSPTVRRLRLAWSVPRSWRIAGTRCKPQIGLYAAAEPGAISPKMYCYQDSFLLFLFWKPLSR